MGTSDFARLTIGVRDSGVGGLTVARRILEILPGANLLYFADTAHVPYGDKTPEQVRFYALSISDFLVGQGAQIVVFACNTTSAYALDAARERFEVPLVGVIEPGARLAARQTSGKVGVLATAATVASGMYTRVLFCLNPDLHVREVACPAFVPLIESERTDSREVLAACHYYLTPLLRFGADTIVLGCTHYPLLLPRLQEVAPHVRFVDPALAVAQEVAARAAELQPPGSGDGHRFWVSGAQTGVANWVRRLLDIPHPHLEVGPVFE